MHPYSLQLHNIAPPLPLSHSATASPQVGVCSYTSPSFGYSCNESWIYHPVGQTVRPPTLHALTPPHARDPLAFQLTGITGQHGGDGRQPVCSLQPTVLLQHHANRSDQHKLCQSHRVVRAIWKVHNLCFFVGVLGSALTTLMQCVPAAAVEGGRGCRRSCCCRRQPV